LIEHLDVILSEGETYSVEFKQNPDKTVVEEVCAFANASGGKIYIGITDENVLVGTDISNRARAQLRDTIEKVDPQVDYSIEIDKENKVFVVTVSEGNNKPYQCPTGFYLRMGAGKQKLSRNHILEFFKREGNVRYDSIVRGDLPVLHKFNQTAYERYLNMAGISKVLDQDTVLRNLNCIADVDGKTVFTNAGALFFRDNEEDVIFDHARIVCALFKGNTRVHILDAQHYHADIVSNIDNAVLFMKRNLRMRYVIKTVQREEILELPEVAFKEAIVNAVCHRNYFETGANISVEIYDDRVEITSPGGLPSGVTKSNFGTVSIRRNPLIASLLYRIDYVERMGTGIRRMKEATESIGAPDPEYHDDTFFTVILKRFSVEEWAGFAGNDDNRDNNRGTAIGENIVDGIVDNIVVNNIQKSIMQLMRGDPKISAASISKKIGIAPRNVQVHIRALKEKNLIERAGSAKGGHWVVKGRTES